MVNGVGPIKLKKLLEKYSSIDKVCEVINAPIQAAEKEIQKAKNLDASLFCLEDDEYPSLLKNIYDPPPVLYVKGEKMTLDTKALAIVGTRRASRYGKEMAKKLAFELASSGVTVVSGMAVGIDTAAHEGALEANGKTIAVFGCGVDVIYPPSNRELAKKIELSGALVSEFPLGTGAERGNFPRRNRVIAGLALGTIVVEGHYDSGAMITAKYALEEGREVFAVPGDVQHDQSKGPHWLIKQGAKLVESVDDILEELPTITTRRISDSKLKKYRREQDYSNLTEDEQKIVKTLSFEPKYIDSISAETHLSIPQVSSLLMMLEVKKIIRQLPGKMFVLY